MRFMIRHGIKLPEIIEIAKKVLVSEAERELSNVSGEVSASKLSVMTGVHRGEVSRLLKGESKLADYTDILSRVIGTWQLSKRFTDGDGRPKLLTFEGTDSEFSRLVESVTKEISPYTVYYELERTGAIRRATGKDAENRVRLEVQSHGTSQDYGAAMRFIAQDIDDLIRATEINLSREAAIPQLQLRTYFDNIAIESLPLISEWLIKRGREIHDEVRAFVGERDLDINPDATKKGGGYVSLGTFSLVTRPTTVEAPTRRKRGRKKREE